MNAILKILMKRLTIRPSEQTTLAKSLVMIAAGIVASFSFNALAADTATPPSVQDYIQHMERMKTMTPEQRAKEREAMHEETRNLTPEQRAERRKAMREYWEKMPAEERARHRAERRKEMDSMTPEQRAERRKQMHEQHWQQMSPEERAEHRREMRERFEKMSPEERRDFKRGMDGMDGNCDMPPEDCPYNKPAKD